MLLLLAAIDEGLAPASTACRSRRSRGGELLGIPEDLRIVAGATVGRPLPTRLEQGDEPGDAAPPEQDELVSWNRWSTVGARTGRLR